MKIEMYVSTNHVGSKVSTSFDVDDEDWNRMNEEEKEEFMLEQFWEAGLIEWGWDEK